MARWIPIFLLLAVLAHAVAGAPVLTAIWDMEGSSLDPSGQPRTDEGGSLDPDGQPRADEGGSLDPSGSTADNGASLDPNGQPRTDNGSSLDPDGRT